jgi:hypothetical protein
MDSDAFFEEWRLLVGDADRKDVDHWATLAALCYLVATGLKDPKPFSKTVEGVRVTIEQVAAPDPTGRWLLGS